MKEENKDKFNLYVTKKKWGPVKVMAAFYDGSNGSYIKEMTNGSLYPSPVLEPSGDNPSGEYLQCKDGVVSPGVYIVLYLDGNDWNLTYCEEGLFNELYKHSSEPFSTDKFNIKRFVKDYFHTDFSNTMTSIEFLRKYRDESNGQISLTISKKQAKAIVEDPIKGLVDWIKENVKPEIVLTYDKMKEPSYKFKKGCVYTYGANDCDTYVFCKEDSDFLKGPLLHYSTGTWKDDGEWSSENTKEVPYSEISEKMKEFAEHKYPKGTIISYDDHTVVLSGQYSYSRHLSKVLDTETTTDIFSLDEGWAKIAPEPEKPTSYVKGEVYAHNIQGEDAIIFFCTKDSSLDECFQGNFLDSNGDFYKCHQWTPVVFQGIKYDLRIANKDILSDILCGFATDRYGEGDSIWVEDVKYSGSKSYDYDTNEVYCAENRDIVLFNPESGWATVFIDNSKSLDKTILFPQDPKAPSEEEFYKLKEKHGSLVVVEVDDYVCILREPSEKDFIKAREESNEDEAYRSLMHICLVYLTEGVDKEDQCIRDIIEEIRQNDLFHLNGSTYTLDHDSCENAIGELWFKIELEPEYEHIQLFDFNYNGHSFIVSFMGQCIYSSEDSEEIPTGTNAGDYFLQKANKILAAVGKAMNGDKE